MLLEKCVTAVSYFFACAIKVWKQYNEYEALAFFYAALKTDEFFWANIFSIKNRTGYFVIVDL